MTGQIVIRPQRRKRLKSIAITVVISLTVIGLVAGCTQAQDSSGPTYSTPQPAYKNITARELKKMLEKKDFLLVDVHVPEQKHIDGTDLVIPFDRIEQNIDKFPSDKNAKIVLYCRSGSMSQEASQKLVGLGYTNVYNLQGGTYAWQAAGYPVGSTK